MKRTKKAKNDANEWEKIYPLNQKCSCACGCGTILRCSNKYTICSLCRDKWKKGDKNHSRPYKRRVVRIERLYPVPAFPFYAPSRSSSDNSDDET